MRLDKFLKVSRLIKRRTLAKEVCDSGRVQVGGRPAKAGTDLQVGDVVRIDFGRRVVAVRVASLRENARAAEAAEMYALLDESFKEDAPGRDAP